jgi:PAS domain-containing protein
MGAVGSAYCLRGFPSAARLTVLVTALPIVLQLVGSRDTILICTGINLSLFLILLIGAMNADYRRFSKLIAARARMLADGNRIRRAETLAREREAKVKEIAARFDTALNNMSQGLCFFDGAQRLIVCNRRYIDMYGLPPEVVHPGMSLRQIAEISFDAGWGPDVTRETFLGWIDGVGVIDHPAVTILELKNGRVYEIRHQLMPDRGWVATHEDVTERYQTERALTEAKASAERAEREARAAHANPTQCLGHYPRGIGDLRCRRPLRSLEPPICRNLRRKSGRLWRWVRVSKTRCAPDLSAGNIQMPRAANKNGYANDWLGTRNPTAHMSNNCQATAG